MRLAKGFITQEFRGEQLMVAVGEAAKRFRGLARSNATAAFIVDRLKTETTEAEIVSAVLEEFEADEARVRTDVARIIGQLRSIGAIEE